MTTEKPKKSKFAAYVRQRTKENKSADRQRAAADRLSGLEYMNQPEAARFCCLSVRQFRTVSKEHGLHGFYFGGRLCYRRVDLIKLMEAAANG
jgi:hypothetical protein